MRKLEIPSDPETIRAEIAERERTWVWLCGRLTKQRPKTEEHRLRSRQRRIAREVDRLRAALAKLSR